jgi:hypothetical protein
VEKYFWGALSTSLTPESFAFLLLTFALSGNPITGWKPLPLPLPLNFEP